MTGYRSPGEDGRFRCTICGEMREAEEGLFTIDGDLMCRACDTARQTAALRDVPLLVRREGATTMPSPQAGVLPPRKELAKGLKWSLLSFFSCVMFVVATAYSYTAAVHMLNLLLWVGYLATMLVVIVRAFLQGRKWLGLGLLLGTIVPLLMMVALIFLFVLWAAGSAIKG